jgi:hypothetical protein
MATVSMVIPVSKTHKIRMYAYASGKAVIRESIKNEDGNDKFVFKPRRKRGQTQADALDIINAHMKAALTAEDGVSYLKPILEKLEEAKSTPSALKKEPVEQLDIPEIE